MEAQASTIRQLAQQVEAQRETIRLLRDALCDVSSVPTEWGLTRREAQVFLLLVRREVQTLETLSGCLWRAWGDNITDPQTVHSYISRLRTKLGPFGVELKSKRHTGYWLVGRERYAHMVKAVA